MANVIDILVSKQAQAELDKVIASLKLTHEEIIKINQQGLKINSGASPKNPQQMNQSVKETIALTAQLTAEEQKLLVATNRVESLRQKQIQNQIKKNALTKSTIDLKNKETLQRDRNEKAIAREEQKLAVAGNAYNKLQAELNKLTFSYQNLATRQAQGATLTKAEADQMAYLEKRIQSHDKTLKAVDASMGKYQRNVGNYASGFNPMTSAVSRLAQEVPNLGQSFQIFAMSIGNNIAAVKDAIDGIITKNKELQANGEKTKRVMSQVFSSIFSWNTALYVGIALFIAYSKEIENFTKELLGMSSVLDETSKQVADGQAASIKQTKEEIKYNQNLISVLAAKNKNDKEKKIAFDELVNKYPYYLGHLKQDEYFTDKGRVAVSKLSDAIKDYNASQIKRGVLIDLQIRKEAILADFKSKKADETHRDAQKRENETSTDYIKRISRQHKLISSMSASFIQSARDYIGVSSQVNKLEKEITQETINSIGILYKENKEKEKTAKKKKEKIDLNFREIESEYDLRRAILERQKAEISDRMDNESLSLNDRLKAREEFSKKSIELLDLELRKEKEVLLFKQAEDFSKNNLALKNKEISYAQYSENIKDINKRVSNEIATSDLAYSLKWNDLLNNDAEFYKKIQEQKVRFTNDTNKLILDSETKKFEKISKDETKTLLTRNLAHQKYIDNSKQQLQIDKMLEMSKSTSQEQLDNIIKKYQLLGEALDELATPYETARKGFEDYLKSITSNELDSALNKIGVSSLKMFLDIDENGQTTFSKMWELAETTQEKFALAFKGIGDVFQEVAGLMSQASQQRYEEELYRLEQQKNVSLQFAGESAIAKEEIEKQYEQRKKEIQRREAEATKRLAIFNIAIDTAQAIMAAAPKIPLMVAMGVLGAAQIAMVSSQSIPEFWKGTDNAPEGLAWTQEKGAEVITDKKGNIKTLGNNKGAQLTYLEKGDKVYKSQQDYINNTLVGAGIQPMRENNSLTSSDFNNGISKLAKTMQSNKGSNTQVFLNNKQINTDYSKGKNV